MSAAVRGNVFPALLYEYFTKPEQSKPEEDIPPILYFVPNSVLAVLIAFVWYEAASAWPAKEPNPISANNDNPTKNFFNKIFYPPLQFVKPTILEKLYHSHHRDFTNILHLIEMKKAATFL